MDRSLPASQRVRKRADYLRIQGSGRKIALFHFLAFFSPSGLPQARLGVTVSRRVGKAVVRNRVKRLVRETFRLQKAALRPGTDLVIVARPAAAGITFAQALDEMEKILGRMAKWRD